MKRWCEAPYVWTYDHGVEPHTQECWNAFCAAGDDLLAQILVLVEQKPDARRNPGKSAARSNSDFRLS
jgi:hypothetical protein